MTTKTRNENTNSDPLTSALMDNLLQVSINNNNAITKMQRVFIGFCILTMVWIVSSALFWGF